MRTRLVASVVVVLAGGIWLTCVSAGAPATPVHWTEDSGLSEPKVVEKVNPVYPEEARAEKVQGAVVLDVTVDTGGGPSGVKVTKDPDPRLSQAAVDAVKQWRFEPARTAKGDPVAVVYTVTVAFKLQ
jgi:protein TonB